MGLVIYFNLKIITENEIVLIQCDVTISQIFYYVYQSEELRRIKVGCNSDTRFLLWETHDRLYIIVSVILVCIHQNFGLLCSGIIVIN